MLSFMILGAACAINTRPTSVDPVNDNFLTTGLAQTSSPKPREFDVGVTDSNPAGRPARSANAARANAESGVSAAGLKMIEQPAASAGANLRATMADGKFQAAMAATTPTGCFNTINRLSRV